MLKNIKTSKFYRIKKEDVENSSIKYYNMLVVEYNDGEIEELLFTDLDLQKSLIRKNLHKEIIPKYKIRKRSNKHSVYVFMLVLSFIIGYLI